MLIKNLLYILQSEYYDNWRFLRFVYSHYRWWDLEKRQKLDWTAKARAIQITTWIIFLVIFLLTAATGNILFAVLILIVEILVLPLLVILSIYFLKPFEIYFKKKIVEKAAGILKKKKITTIGITGSYGKTSTKEILAAILSKKFRIAKTPKNTNTDIGIARFVADNLKDEEILIVEMGAFYPGDIVNICNFVKPDHAILTGINESHLEKFGSLENIMREKFSLVQGVSQFSVLNFNDQNIKKNYEKFGLKNFLGIARENAKDINFLEDYKGVEFNYLGEKFSCGLLASHSVTQILMCVEIGKKLGLDIEEIKAGVNGLKPFSHRLEPVYNAESDIWVIDDSYNGNRDSFISGLEVLGRARGRKIVLTPGLAELGKMAKTVHNEIGEMYAQKADLVLLVKNKVSYHIISGMEKKGFRNYKIYNTTQEAHADLKNVLKKGDTIIFQNDWTDNYF